MEPKIKISDHIDLAKLCSGWQETENSYELESSLFDEFISIDKNTRYVTHCGYNNIINEWFWDRTARYDIHYEREN